MEDKNKNKWENIVRRDDSDNEIEPDFLEVLKSDFGKLLARKLKNRNVTFKKPFGISEPLFDNPLDYIRGALKYEEMEARVDQDLSRYIQLKVNYFEVLGEEVNETDLQQLKLYWLDEKIQSFDNEISNTNDGEERLKLEKLREHLEKQKGGQNPPGITFENLFVSPDKMQAALVLAQEAGLEHITERAKYKIAGFWAFLKIKELVKDVDGQKACEAIAKYFNVGGIRKNLWREYYRPELYTKKQKVFWDKLNSLSRIIG